MAYSSKADVRCVLEPYHPRIRGVIERAWAEWQFVEGCRADKGLGPILYPRTTANHMFDAMARNAISEFGSDPSVHLKAETQTIKLIFKGKVVARYKKGNESLLGRNILTQAVLAFTSQDGILPGLPPEMGKVDLVWMPNDLRTKIDSVHVIFRHRDALLWDYEIDVDREGEVVPLFPIPTTDGDATSSTDDLVKPRIPPSKEGNKESE